LNRELDGKLGTAIAIFTNTYPKKFLHQLISGQLDVDRMDYLTRDSFFTGVSEGVIGYDRIIKMLTVHNGELMVEEKAIYSIEKFLVSRRLMYWQVYLHKTVLCAEKMLIKIIVRAKELITKGLEVRSASPVLDFFLHGQTGNASIETYLENFCLLDDYDVMATIKNWVFHPDRILSNLCRFLVDRKLLKVRLRAEPFDERAVHSLIQAACKKFNIPEKDAAYLVFTGETTNTTYNPGDEKINILFRDETVKDISKVDNALIHQTLASPVKKFYICYPGD
jgi:HD superfamily phosphohydrolase